MTSACGRDGNGYLGAADLAKVYKAIGENLDDDLVRCSCASPLLTQDPPQIDELIREADKDGDGQIGEGGRSQGSSSLVQQPTLSFML